MKVTENVIYICRQIMFKNVYFADKNWKRILRYNNVLMWY